MIQVPEFVKRSYIGGKLFQRPRRWSTLDLTLALLWLTLATVSYGGAWWLLRVTHPNFGLWGSAYAALNVLTYGGDIHWFAKDTTFGGLLFACVIAHSASFVVGAGGLVRVVIVLGRERNLLVRDHVVILGAGRVGLACLSAIEQLNSDPARTAVREVVFIDRTEVFVPAHKGIRCTSLVGDVSDARLLRRARVDTAQYLIAATGDDLENLRAASTAFELVDSQQNRYIPLQTYVRVGNHHLSQHVTNSSAEREKATKSISYREPDYTPKHEDHYVYRTAFNVFELAAKRIFSENMHDGDSPATVNEHLVVCGFGRFGQAIALEASRCKLTDGTWKFVHIDVVDLKAERLVQEFAFDQQSLELRTRIRPRSASILSQEVWDAIAEEHGDMASTVFVCTDADEANLTYATVIAARVARGETSACETKVFVRQQYRATSRSAVDARVELAPVVDDAVIGSLGEIFGKVAIVTGERPPAQ